MTFDVQVRDKRILWILLRMSFAKLPLQKVPKAGWHWRRNDPYALSQCRKRGVYVCAYVLRSSNLSLFFRFPLFPAMDHHCFRGDHNFAASGQAKFTNIKGPKKSCSTVYTYLTDCYTLQLQAMKLKGNIEDLPKSLRMRLLHLYSILQQSILSHFVFKKYSITHL